MEVLDPRCPWVTVERSNAVPRWKLTGFAYQDPTEAGGRHNIYVTVLDERGAPLSGVKVWQKWPDAEAHEVQQLTISGTTDFGIYGGPFYPDRGQVGAYWVYVDGASDIVRGMGLPVNFHVNYYLTFQRVVQATEPPPQPPPNSPPGLEATIAYAEVVLNYLKGLRSR